MEEEDQTGHSWQSLRSRYNKVLVPQEQAKAKQRKSMQNIKASRATKSPSKPTAGIKNPHTRPVATKHDEPSAPSDDEEGAITSISDDDDNGSQSAAEAVPRTLNHAEKSQMIRSLCNLSSQPITVVIHALVVHSGNVDRSVRELSPVLSVVAEHWSTSVTRRAQQRRGPARKTFSLPQ